MNLRRLAGAAIFVAACAAPGCDSESKPVATIRLATTTNTRDTGLLDVLLPEFRKDTGIEVQAVAVSTGEALKCGERGDADVVLVHTRKAEREFMRAGLGIERKDVWWNRFVVVGPTGEHASYGVQNYETEMTRRSDGKTPLALAAVLMDNLHTAGATFVSRGDDSGTHKREMELWGKKFQKWPGYVETGQGMSQTLVAADEKYGYTLAEEATFLKMRGRLRLKVIVRGDPALANPYGAVLVNPAQNPKGPHDAAKNFYDWLTGERCRSLVQALRVDGERVLFLPDEKPADEAAESKAK